MLHGDDARAMMMGATTLQTMHRDRGIVETNDVAQPQTYGMTK